MLACNGASNPGDALMDLLQSDKIHEHKNVVFTLRTSCNCSHPRNPETTREVEPSKPTGIFWTIPENCKTINYSVQQYVTYINGSGIVWGFLFSLFGIFVWIYGSVQFPCYLQHFEPGSCYFHLICSMFDFEPFYIHSFCSMLMESAAFWPWKLSFQRF